MTCRGDSSPSHFENGTTTTTTDEDGAVQGPARSSEATSAADDGPVTTTSGMPDLGPPMVRFDLAPPPDGLARCMADSLEDVGVLDFSYIWIANSTEGTVSKIDTVSMTEVGRYLTRPDGAGDPSRTSVNLNGDVAIANRNGGITVIAARSEDCVDPTQTSTGSSDIRPWPDGCVTWHAPFEYDSQRPVAWTQGRWSWDTCRYEDLFVWTAGHRLGEPFAEVLLLRGTDGSVVDLGIADGVDPEYKGLYGGAVDRAGDFWAIEFGRTKLFHATLQTVDVEARLDVPVPAYGITVDREGYVWTCDVSVSRFDPQTNEVVFREIPVAGSHYGCMEDGQGTLWIAGNAVVGIDTHTLDVVHQFEMPSATRGISLDFHGYVWSPETLGDEAYRIDPLTGQIDRMGGLVGAYTYSDMTGFALRNVGFPEG